jgi:hypothetical protein
VMPAPVRLGDAVTGIGSQLGRQGRPVQSGGPRLAEGRLSQPFWRISFGDGGLVSFIVSRRRQLVVVEQVMWIA